jgi:hypothetical protein
VSLQHPGTPLTCKSCLLPLHYVFHVPPRALQASSQAADGGFALMWLAFPELVWYWVPWETDWNGKVLSGSHPSSLLLCAALPAPLQFSLVMCKGLGGHGLWSSPVSKTWWVPGTGSRAADRVNEDMSGEGIKALEAPY